MAADNKEAGVRPVSSQCFTQLQPAESREVNSSPTQHPHDLHRDMGGLRRRRRRASQRSHLFYSEAVSAAESFIILSVVLIVSPSLLHYLHSEPEKSTNTFLTQFQPSVHFKVFFLHTEKQTPVSREGGYERSVVLCINTDWTLFRSRAEYRMDSSVLWLRN